MPTHVTHSYATVQARIPLELLEAVTRYTRQHRCTVSDLIREGLTWRIEQDVPGRGLAALLEGDDAPEAREALATLIEAAVTRALQRQPHRAAKVPDAQT